MQQNGTPFQRLILIAIIVGIISDIGSLIFFTGPQNAVHFFDWI